MLSRIKRKYKNFLKITPLLNSFFGRKFFQFILENLFFIEVLRRNKLKIKFPNKHPEFEIDDDDGFLLCPPNSFKSSKNAVVEAEKIFHSQKHKILEGKSYLREISLDGHLTKNSPLMNFALDSEVLGLVSTYLGTLPILRELRMMYSPNQGEVEGGSQFFHVDKEYPRMMKIFLFITPSTDEDGPLTTLSAKKSETVWKKIGSLKSIHRVTDEQVFESFSIEDTQMIIGEKGSVGFLDVARCLHFGSRPNTNSKPRLIVWYVYHHFCGDKFPFSLKGGKRFKFKDFDHNSFISEPTNSILFG